MPELTRESWRLKPDAVGLATWAPLLGGGRSDAISWMVGMAMTYDTSGWLRRRVLRAYEQLGSP
jgi:hypothetical protein